MCLIDKEFGRAERKKNLTLTLYYIIHIIQVYINLVYHIQLIHKENWLTRTGHQISQK